MKKLYCLFLACLFSFPLLQAQNIAVHQYRRVANTDMAEYLRRETTYWKKFVEQEVKKGNLLMWTVLQRVGGEDQENQPNILLINVYKDIDKPINWGGITDMFPNARMEDMSPFGLSKDVLTVYVRNLGNNIRSSSYDPNANNFVWILYHPVNNLNTHLTFESEKWKPLVERSWKEGKNSMVGWGNGVILNPESPAFPYQAFSYDIYPSLKAALGGGFADDFEIPDGYFNDLIGNYAGTRDRHLYRVVTTVSAPNN